MNGKIAELCPIPFTLHYRLGNGKGHDAVIRSKAALGKKIKVLAAVVIEFKSRTDNVSDNRPKHECLTSSINARVKLLTLDARFCEFFYLRIKLYRLI